MESQLPPTFDSLTLSSGRTLAWSVYGGELSLESEHPPAIVFYFHGGSGSRLDGGFCPDSTLQKNNARYISIDRPGIGQSTYDPSRRVADWPADVLAIADHLGIDKFYVIGVSSGGPYALACAKEIPRVQHGGTGRLLGVAAVSSFYPWSLGTTGAALGFRIMWTLVAWVPLWLFALLLDLAIGSKARNPDPAVLERLWDKNMASLQDMERRTLADERVHRATLASLRESFRQGSKGNVLDLKLVNEWASGFDLKDLDGRGITLWHGTADINVPFQMAERAAAAMPAAKATFFKGEPHISASVTHSDEILSALLGQ